MSRDHSVAGADRQFVEQKWCGEAMWQDFYLPLQKQTLSSRSSGHFFVPESSNLGQRYDSPEEQHSVAAVPQYMHIFTIV